MYFVFLPSLIIIILSFFKINQIVMSFVATSVIFPAIYLFFNHMHNDYFMVDDLNAFVLLVSSVVAVGVSISMISLPYRLGLDDKQIKHFYLFFGIFFLGLTLSILSNNMGLYWIGLEFATLSTVYMIKIKYSTFAHNESWKYLIVGAIAISLILFGIILIYSATKPLLHEEAMNFYSLIENAKAINGYLFEIGFFLVATGMFIKMGFFPMNLWIADIERSAIYQVAALFSGILESAVLLGFFRLSEVEKVVNNAHLITFTYVYGLLTLFMVSFLIYRAKDYMRLFSLSGIEHMSLIVIFWVSGGYFAALLHFAAHAFIKPALFLSTAVLESHRKYNFRGTLKGIGGTSALLISMLMLAIISLPPSPMFFSEIYGFKAMIESATLSSHFLLMVGVVFFILLLLSIVFYKFITIYQEALYEEGEPSHIYRSEILTLSIFVVATLTLILPPVLQAIEGIMS